MKQPILNIGVITTAHQQILSKVQKWHDKASGGTIESVRVIAWTMKEFKKKINQYEKKLNALAGIKSNTKIQWKKILRVVQNLINK